MAAEKSIEYETGIEIYGAVILKEKRAAVKFDRNILLTCVEVGHLPFLWG